MNREIKFRAWSEPFGMRNVFGWQGATLFVANDGMGFDPMLMENWTLMQYTGLKDKNGKEIFEGDVVKYPDKVKTVFKGRPGEREVVHKSLPFGVKWQTIYGEYGVHGYGFDLDASPEREIEIIGNIHENPELLSPH